MRQKGKGIKKEPRIRQLLILAHQIENLVKSGKAKNYKQIAEWLNISRTRINQIINLLLLSPTIQKEITFSNPQDIFPVTEEAARKLTSEINWKAQEDLWNPLVKNKTF